MLRCVFALACLVLLAGPLPAQTPEWIWGDAGTNAETRYFRKNFLFPPFATRAVISVAGDDGAEVFLNGRRLAKNAAWAQPSKASLAGRLVRGENTLAVVATNGAGPAGLLLLIEFAGNGQKINLVSDPSWMTATVAPDGWMTNAPAGPAWKPVRSLGQVGIAPWGDVISAPAATPASALDVADGFRVELVHSAEPAEGSWVAMTRDDRGRLIISPQGNEPLLRFTVDADGKVSRREPVNLPVRSAMGLLHAFGALYVNGQGPEGYHLYRLTDSNGDDSYDRFELIRRWQGGAGEHGTHGLVKGPDDRIYITSGNFANVPADVSPASPLRDYAEDLPLPRLEDGNGFGAGRHAPGGFVLRIDRNGGSPELFAGGQRNAYDLDFSPDGELFTFDSDMEGDWGAPWYRPNRIHHLVSGAEHGFREGSGKWPAYYADSLPPVVEVGLGSPTGVKFGTGTRFPARYQRAMFGLDWGYGRIVAVHLTPAGSSFTGTYENFLTGKPLNVTDVEVGADGALYFITGGRGTQSGLYRITYAGAESTEPDAVAAADGAEVKLRERRRAVEAFQVREDPRMLAEHWEDLGDPDRTLRFAARLALERQPVASWADRALAETNSARGLTAMLALARVGGKPRQAAVFQGLSRWPLTSLPEEEFLLKLRVIEVSFARHGVPDEIRPRAIAELSAQFPARTWSLNRELAQMLAALAAPDITGKLLDLRDAAATQEEQVLYQSVLCRLEGGWTVDLRRRLFAWFGTEPGTGIHRDRHPAELLGWFADVGLAPANGASFGNLLKGIRGLALRRVPPAELPEMAQILSGKLPVASPVAAPRPAVREWTTADLQPALARLAEKRDPSRGRAIYAAAQCGACHALAGTGGAVGPDLTGVGSRFSPLDLLKSLTEPSAVVSEQYQFTMVQRRNGEELVGRVLGDTADGITLLTDPLKGTRVELKRTDIASARPSPLSPMPEGLLNSFDVEEILDLLAYLRGTTP